MMWMYDKNARRQCTTWMHDVDARRGCTTWMHDMHDMDAWLSLVALF